jgi:glycosyltransferase involved in cell wall biosynthesis
MNGQNEVKKNKSHILGLPSWYPWGEGDHNGLFCLAQLEALAASGHQVGLLAAVSHPNAAGSRGLEVQQYNWGFACVALYRSGPNPLLQAFRYAWAMHKAWKHYVVLAGYPQNILVLVAWKAGLFARWLQIRYGISYYVIEHWGLYISDEYRNKSIYLKFLFKFIFTGAYRVGAVSETLGRALYDHKITQRIPQIVPNVVDTDVYRPDQNAAQNRGGSESILGHADRVLKDQPPLLMHVSNLADVKNFDFVLDVFAAFRKRYPEARLWVAGAFSPSETTSKYLADKSNHDIMNHVDWFGFADQQTLLRHYRRATALILASRHETFSIVAAEAFACGCPVLSTPLSALDAFGNWGTRCSLPAQDPEAWADVLEGWTKSKPFVPPHAWEAMHQAYGKKAVGESISKWITEN